MSYLLVNHFSGTPVSTTLYATAMAFHFLSVDAALRHEHGTAYDRTGRFVLAGVVPLGWGMGLFFSIPHDVLALFVAFISGAIIVNNAIMELPPEKDGRFLPFMAGSIAYGLVLLPLG